MKLCFETRVPEIDHNFGFAATYLLRSEKREGRSSENTFLFKLMTSVLFVGQLMSLIRTSGSGSGM